MKKELIEKITREAIRKAVTGSESFTDTLIT